LNFITWPVVVFVVVVVDMTLLFWLFIGTRNHLGLNLKTPSTFFDFGRMSKKSKQFDYLTIHQRWSVLSSSSMRSWAIFEYIE